MRRELADPDFSTFLAFPSSSQPGDDRDEQGDSPVGFATLRRNSVKTDHAHRNPDPAAYVEVKRLYVDQAFHGSGAGRALMDCLMREVKEACAAAKQAGMGTPTVWLGVWEGNARAQRFYEKYGFREDGEHVFMVGEVRDRDLLFVLRE
ncbi:acyl-CoA N-acyltransferase [Zopfochytrium polystomum]|nr:acyl-CoA N-acyltransferase [Zopfochytrium polystomum]